MLILRGLVLVDNATTAVNTILKSIRFSEGDEILVTDHAYPPVRYVAEQMCRRTGTSLVTAAIPIGSRDQEIVHAITSVLTDRTRLAIVDHVTSPTGMRFPIHAIQSTLRERAVPLLVDAAHTPGMLDVDLESLRSDFWTGNFHKWVCSPRGAAALYVAPEHRDSIDPLAQSIPTHDDFQGRFAWGGTNDYSAFIAVPAAIQFMDEYGWSEVRSHNKSLAQQALLGVKEILGAEAPVDPEMSESMTLVSLPIGIATTRQEARALAALIADELAAEVSIVPWNGRGYWRVSAQIYNELDEYLSVAERLKSLLGGS